MNNVQSLRELIAHWGHVGHEGLPCGDTIITFYYYPETDTATVDYIEEQGDDSIVELDSLAINRVDDWSSYLDGVYTMLTKYPKAMRYAPVTTIFKGEIAVQKDDTLLEAIVSEEHGSYTFMVLQYTADEDAQPTLVYHHVSSDAAEHKEKFVFKVTQDFGWDTPEAEGCFDWIAGGDLK